jgi:hypothetical protein
MKAPEFIKIATDYFYVNADKNTKELGKLKEGDIVFLSFGVNRERNIEYVVSGATRRVLKHRSPGVVEEDSDYGDNISLQLRRKR